MRKNEYRNKCIIRSKKNMVVRKKKLMGEVILLVNLLYTTMFTYSPRRSMLPKHVEKQ